MLLILLSVVSAQTTAECPTTPQNNNASFIQNFTQADQVLHINVTAIDLAEQTGTITAQNQVLEVFKGKATQAGFATSVENSGGGQVTVCGNGIKTTITDR